MEVAKHLYVDLDSLLDTRFTTLAKMSESLSKKMLLDNSYENRTIDSFNFISRKVFREAYKYRNNDTLNKSYPTNILEMCYEYLMTISHLFKQRGEHSDVIVYINIYPYVLETSFLQNIKDFFLQECPIENIKIQFIDFNNTNLSPNWLRDKIGHMIKYDGQYWLDLHLANKNLLETPLVEMSLVVPALQLRKGFIKQDKLEDYFKEIKQYHGLFVDIFYVPANVFSIKMKK